MKFVEKSVRSANEIDTVSMQLFDDPIDRSISSLYCSISSF